MPPIRVLIVDDDPMMLTALRAFVELATDLSVIGEARNGKVAVSQCRALHPDVVLMDMQMPILDGVAAIAQIHQAHPAIGLLALTTFSSERYVVPSLRAGASGYLVKDATPEEIADAIRRVHRGESVIDPQVLQHVVEAVAQSGEPRGVPSSAGTLTLSAREREVIECLAQGLSNREIARQMSLTESTVKSHIARISAKLGVRDRVQVVIRAHEWGLARLGLTD